MCYSTFIECLSESRSREAVRDGRSPEKGELPGGTNQCVEFFPDVFDPADPRKGGSFELIQEKKYDNTPEDELRHDVTDELAAYKLAQLPFPGVFGVFYQSDRPTKNALEKKWIEGYRAKTGNAS